MKSEDSGVLPALWWVKPSSRMRARSWSLAAGPRDPRAHFRSLSGRQFMILLGMGTKVSGGCVNLLVVRARAS